MPDEQEKNDKVYRSGNPTEEQPASPVYEPFNLGSWTITNSGNPIAGSGVPLYLPSSKSPPVSNRSFYLTPDLFFQAKLSELDKSINELRAKYNEQTKELSEAREESEQRQRLIAELSATQEEHEKKQDLAFLLKRVNEDAGRLLLQSSEFQDQFSQGKTHPAFVMSVDIRQSTDLMLKARRPELFALFINDLCINLMDIIKNHFGVVDKFTGDGVLAFFPEFYSGQDAGFHAVKAALECHDLFGRLYRRSRGSFTSVLADVGLGIGIDYGETHFLKMADGLTVVGQPVVYACRLGGAPSGRTYLNQPAYERVSGRPNSAFLFSEMRHEIKHEGAIIVYQVQPSGVQTVPERPRWASEARA